MQSETIFLTRIPELYLKDHYDVSTADECARHAIDQVNIQVLLSQHCAARGDHV